MSFFTAVSWEKDTIFGPVESNFRSFLFWQGFSTGCLIHIRRFQKYFNPINILISSCTLQFLQFWYQNGVIYFFLIVKSIKVTSGFISKAMKKIARWRHHWNIWHLIVKTKISPLVVCYQGSNGCQKNRQNLRNLYLEV